MDDFILIWEAPPIVKPELRLYYDENGRVLFYTCDKPQGNYVVVDPQTYAQGRPDLMVIDGRIMNGANTGGVVARLVPGDIGTRCAAEDINIVVGDDYEGETITWKLKTYEL